MVHELGHNLCLGHEQSRKDRDDFVHFDSCAENEIPGNVLLSEIRFKCRIGSLTSKP